MSNPRKRSIVPILFPCALLASLGCTPASSTTDEAAPLGTAANFLVLAASTVTSTGPTVIEGDLGLSPGSAITGFPAGRIDGSVHLADGPAEQAQSDLFAAWNLLNAEPCEFTLDDRELGGLVLTPGVYCFTSPSAALTDQLTLDAQGNADARFVFQIESTLVTASSSSVIMINGGSDCNVFWTVGSSATLGTSTTFIGNILALASITLNTNANVSGRLLAHTGAVTLDSNTIRLDCEPDTTTGPDGGMGEVDSTPARCGDQALDAGEQCDDGNLVDGDGCAADCTIEIPPPPPSVCGNGILEFGEQCDDGNDNNIDGCTNSCYVTT